MASLASVDTQLNRVAQQISGLNDDLEEKKEKLRRLKEAQGELISVKHDFFWRRGNLFGAGVFLQDFPW